jgi:magnesium transporter
MAADNRQEYRETLLHQLQVALQLQNIALSKSLFLDLHPGDQVEVFELLISEHQNYLISLLEDSDVAVLFSHQEDDETLEAVKGIEVDRLADIIEEMEPDEAADLLGDLPPNITKETLEQIEDSRDILQLLKFPDETAGGRMTTDYISVLSSATTSHSIEVLRKLEPDTDVPYYIYVTDPDNKLLGIVGLRELVVSSPDATIASIMDEGVFFTQAMLDQEEVAQIMVTYDLSSLPVIDDQYHLLGVVTHDDIMDVILEEATEDVYKLASVSDSDLEPDSSVKEQIKGRLPWLFLNSLTALFASWVISNFEGLIGQVAVLAIFQSVVAGQGGNAASQSVAMFVRAIALGNIPQNMTIKLLFKQMLVGLLQGLAIGTIVGVGVYLWRGNIYLGIVLGLALVGNLILAGIVGTLIPLGLKAVGQDPALASSVLVTAITDSLGFFIFLSLANHYLPHLL